MTYMDAAKCNKCGEHYEIPFGHNCAPKGTREERLASEMERQRKIYRVGTADVILQRAAIRELQEKGEW